MARRLHAGQQRQQVEQDQEVGEHRHEDGGQLEQHPAHAVLGDAQAVDRPADGGGGDGGHGEGRERGTAEADQEAGVLDLADDRVPLVHVVLLPHGPQAVPHGADPADAGEEQQGTGDDPHRARVGDQAVDAELVRDAGHLVGELVLDRVELLGESSAAPIAAPTAISGKSARKLRKVIAAASLAQWTRSSVS